MKDCTIELELVGKHFHYQCEKCPYEQYFMTVKGAMQRITEHAMRKHAVRLVWTTKETATHV